METSPVQNSQEFLNKRKMAVMLPVFVVPFLGIIFYLFGGGTPAATASMHATGLNTEIPKPAENRHTSSVQDKLSAYKLKDQQEEEAARMRSLDDLSTTSMVSPGGSDTVSVEREPTGLAYTSAPRSYSRQAPDPDRREYEHLNGKVNSFYQTPANNSSVSEAKINRLLELMEKEENGGNIDVDKELKNNQYLQYLQRTLTSGQFAGEKQVKQVSDTTTKKQLKKQIIEVSKHKKPVVHKLPQVGEEETQPNTKPGNSFYSLGGSSTHLTGNTISAMIHDDQTLVTGSTVKLRLLSDIQVQGTIIPANSFIYGVASVKNERLDINIENIRYGKDIVPVDLKVYDNDGMLGVYIPGSIDRDAGKGALGSMASGGSYNVTMASGVKEQLAMQAAQSGINGLKTLASKKTRLVKVQVKANYRVFLKPENS
jgi:conjugative transposon TraM protein